MPTTSNMVDISVPGINARTSLLKSAKASSLFFFLCICMKGIGKSFCGVLGTSLHPGTAGKTLLMIKHGCCAVSADFVSLYFVYKRYIGDEDLPQWLREPFQC